MKISATIIAYNEEVNIRAALESVAWADEIVVIDSESTDKTREVAAACGAKVIKRSWSGFAAQKQFAIDQATEEWIFSLDADERASPALQSTINSLREIDDGARADGFLIARRSYYQGRWIKGGGWYPDRQLRLFKRSLGRWEGPHIHESVRMLPTARIEKISGDILHYGIRDATYHHRLIGERYAPLAAQQMFEAGRRTSPLGVATAGPLAFLRSFVWKGGFRDGLAGISIANFASHHAFLKHLLLWEMQKNSEQ